jgi:hypothetical protein
MSIRSRVMTGLTGAVLLVTAVHGAAAGPVTATYEAAGVQAPNSASICGTTAGCTVGTETFNYVTQAQASAGYTSNFSGTSGTASAYQGTYSAFTVNPADQYGGANGTGNYAVVFGGNNPPSYSLTLTNTATGGGVNYFGIYISALDAGNQLQFYDSGNNLIYTFTSQQLIADLGSCANGHSGNAYCGNPSDYYADSGELFAYVNFFDTVGTFSKLVFSEVGGTGAGFESDNHAVAYNAALKVSGTSVVPEPAGWTILGVGLFALCRARRRSTVRL